MSPRTLPSQVIRSASIFGVGLAAALFLFSTTAHSACALKVADVSAVEFKGHQGKGYEVFDREQHSEVITIRIHRKSGACGFVVGFSTGGNGTFTQRQLRSGGRSLNYQLTKDIGASQILKDIPMASSDEVFTGVFLPGQDSVLLQLYFVIPLLQVAPPGRYRDSIIVSVYEGTLQSAQLRDQEQLTVYAPVPTTAQFILGDSVDFELGHRDTQVYFGEFFSGATRDLKLRARSNSGYRITLRSQHASKMRNLDSRERDEIPYSLTLDGGVIPLAGGDTVTAIQRNGMTAALGNEHNFRFRVGDLGNAGPGTYRDVIRVTLYPSR